MNVKQFLFLLGLALTFPYWAMAQCPAGATELINSPTPGLQSVTVPAGVTSISVTLTGGDGGSFTSGGPSFVGGSAGTSVGTFPVSAGDVLNVIVGEAGANAAAPFGGAGGGGGSAVVNTTTGDILLVAGGGGGGGLNGGGLGAGIVAGSGNGGTGTGNGGGGGGAFSIGAGAPVGGSAGNLAGGNGGTPSFSTGAGGFGFGGGGGGETDGGGGGGYDGGAPYGGGSAFANASGSGVTLTPGVNLTAAGNNGSALICYTAAPVSVPTMSQWGLILLGLSVLALGAIFLFKQKNRQAMA